MPLHHWRQTESSLHFSGGRCATYKIEPPPRHTHTHCFTSPPEQHCVYDRPGHVPFRQTRAEGWVLKDGKVLEDMGANEG